MALSANQVRKYKEPDLRHAPRRGTVKAANTLYRGGATFIDAAAGTLTTDDNAGANAFAGISRDTYLAGATAECDYGQLELITLTGVAALDVTKPVYATADDTYTLTSTNATLVGHVANIYGTNQCWLAVAY